MSNTATETRSVIVEREVLIRRKRSGARSRNHT